jgi:hypothetical protein
VWYLAGHCRAPQTFSEFQPNSGGGELSVTSMHFIMAYSTDRLSAVTLFLIPRLTRSSLTPA